MADDSERAIGRIEANTEALLKSSANQEARILGIERRISWFRGVLAALSAATAAAWAYIVHYHTTKP